MRSSKLIFHAAELVPHRVLSLDHLGKDVVGFGLKSLFERIRVGIEHRLKTDIASMLDKTHIAIVVEPWGDASCEDHDVRGLAQVVDLLVQGF